MSQSFPCLDSPRAQILGKKAKLPESNAPAYLHYESQQQVELAFSFLKKRTSPRGNFSLLLAGRLRPSSKQQTEYFSNPLGLKRGFKKRHFREAEILNATRRVAEGGEKMTLRKRKNSKYDSLIFQ